MEVHINPEAVMQGASVLSAARDSHPSGSLPRVVGVGDQVVDAAMASLEEWWTTMSTGTADDVGALHQLVTSAASAQVTRDRQAAADIEKAGDRAAAVRAV
jgi:hypothetical protein